MKQVCPLTKINPLLVVMLLAFGIRFAAILSIDEPQKVPRSLAEADSPTYYILAQNLISGIGYRYAPDAEPTAKRTPGYPIFLAIVFKFFGRNFNAVRIAQAILDALTAGLVFQLTALLFGNLWSCLLASLGYAIYPPAVISTTYVLTESVYTFLLVASVVALILAIRDRLKLTALASGILFGLANLTRPAGLFIPLLLLAIGVAVRKNTWKYLLLFCVASFIPIMPWASRNMNSLGKPIMTSTLTGANLYKGNHLPTQGAHFESIDDLLTPELKIKLDGLSEVQRDSLLRIEAIKMIKANKAAIASLTLKKIPRLWLNLGYGRKASHKSIAIAGLHIIIIALALYGHFSNKSDVKYLSFLPIGVIIASSAAYLAVASEVRFVFPLMPMMLAFAGEGFRKLLGTLRR